MGKRRKVNFIAMGVIACILAVYAGMHMHVPGFSRVRDGLNEIIMEQIEKSYMTGFAYMQEDHGSNIREWVTSAAMQLMPLGTYVEGKSSIQTDVEDQETYQMILAQQANDENAVDEDGKLIGEEKTEAVAKTSGTPIDASLDKLKNFEYLLSHFYAVDGNTMTGGNQLNAEKLLGKNMKISKEAKGPKVLIYHTHSQETFADSKNGDENTSIVGMGTHLSKILNDTYGIETLHHKGVYDLIDGKLDRSKAYQLAEPEVQKILKKHPSIEVVIDLHRDGVADTTHLVTEVNGRPTAQIMFFNGLSKTKTNGDIAYLPNPYIEDNLAISLQLQMQANSKYPGFARRIFLRGYRYNMHLKPKTLLVEAGAQTNTVAEMRNAMDVLADVLDSVLVE